MDDRNVSELFEDVHDVVETICGYEPNVPKRVKDGGLLHNRKMHKLELLFAD